MNVKHFLEKILTLQKKSPDLNSYKMRIVRWCNGSTKDSGSFCWGSSPYRTTIKTLAKARVFLLYEGREPNGFDHKSWGQHQRLWNSDFLTILILWFYCVFHAISLSSLQVFYPPLFSFNLQSLMEISSK